MSPRKFSCFGYEIVRPFYAKFGNEQIANGVLQQSINEHRNILSQIRPSLAGITQILPGKPAEISFFLEHNHPLFAEPMPFKRGTPTPPRTSIFLRQCIIIVKTMESNVLMKSVIKRTGKSRPTNISTGTGGCSKTYRGSSIPLFARFTPGGQMRPNSDRLDPTR
jgi:hypothetical protein